MATQYLTIRLNTDLDLSTHQMWESMERLLLGQSSLISPDEILEAEVVEHRTKEGWLTTVGT
jgi:hypothetical protein